MGRTLALMLNVIQATDRTLFGGTSGFLCWNPGRYQRLASWCPLLGAPSLAVDVPEHRLATRQQCAASADAGV